MTDKKKEQEEFDPFIAEYIYPETAPIFTAHYQGLEEIKDDCMVCLDTNALLVPYAIGKESVKQIGQTYKNLISEERLMIPAQVVREFAKNRANKLTELHQQFIKKLSGIINLQKGWYPLLEEMESYQKVVQLEGDIDNLFGKYKIAVKEVIEEIRNWTWNDPVSTLYADLFDKQTILDPQIDKQAVLSELERRQLHNIPPGYKDRAKEDKGIGDFLIWMTILDIGQNHKKSTLFISGEEKADWFHKSESLPLYPRYELVDEYRRVSNGQTFHIIPFSRFLDTYGASESTVQEVKEEEHRRNIELNLIGQFLMKWNQFEMALFEKCEEINSGMFKPDRATAGIMLQFLSEHEAISLNFFHLARNATYIRNNIVHGRVSDISINAVEETISVVDKLIEELRNI